jgi:hypothetical protein
MAVYGARPSVGDRRQFAALLDRRPNSVQKLLMGWQVVSHPPRIPVQHFVVCDSVFFVHAAKNDRCMSCALPSTGCPHPTLSLSLTPFAVPTLGADQLGQGTWTALD